MKKIINKIFKGAILGSVVVGTLGICNVSNAMESSKINEGYYTIKNVYSNKNLNVSDGKTANGTNINVYKENGNKNQIYKVDNVKSEYIISTSLSEEKVVNVKGDSVKNKANVMLYSKVKNGHSTQKWIFEKVSDGYIIRSVGDKKQVLTSTGNENNSNVNVQSYKKGNKKQIWKLNKVSLPKDKNETKNQKTVSQIKKQITSTYKKCKQITGRSNFRKQCSLYVYSQLKVLGIYQTPNTYWNGNQWYHKLTANGKTKTGYTQKKYAGKNCLSKIVSTNKNKNVYNVVVSFPNSYVSGKNHGSGGAGHVLFIHAIIDGKVYYSDNYNYGSIPEGGVIVKTVSEFTNYFSYHYGGPTGAIHFVK